MANGLSGASPGKLNGRNEVDQWQGRVGDLPWHMNSQDEEGIDYGTAE